MKSIIVWLIHFAAGTIAVIAAIVAFTSRKGSRRHILAGRYFIASMLVMLVSGGVAGWLKPSLDDVLLATLVGYTALTAWLSVYRCAAIRRPMEWLALAFILLLGLGITFAPLVGLRVNNPSVISMDIAFCSLFAIGDSYYLMRKNLSYAYRLSRHVWRICFTLFWSTLALGDKINKMMHSTIDELPFVAFGPGLVIIGLLFNWLYQVHKRYRAGKTSAPVANVSSVGAQ
jgi:hypothetical protein